MRFSFKIILGSIFLLIFNSCKTYLDSSNKEIKYGSVTIIPFSDYNKLIYKSDSFGIAEDEFLSDPIFSVYSPKKLKSIRTSGSNILLEFYNDQYISIIIKCREGCLNKDLQEISLSSEDIRDLFEIKNFAYENSLLQNKVRVNGTLANEFVEINLLNIKTNLLDKYIGYSKRFIFIKEGFRSKKFK